MKIPVKRFAVFFILPLSFGLAFSAVGANAQSFLSSSMVNVSARASVNSTVNSFSSVSIANRNNNSDDDRDGAIHNQNNHDNQMNDRDESIRLQANDNLLRANELRVNEQMQMQDQRNNMGRDREDIDNDNHDNGNNRNDNDNENENGNMMIPPIAIVPRVPAPSSTAPGSFDGMVSLNFDDGNIDAFNNAVPIMQSDGLVGTFYVVTNRIGAQGFLSQDDLMTLQNAGDEIGAHSRSHPDLTTLSDAELQNEIAGSKADLAAIGINATTFAYPFGSFNAHVEQAVKNAGFIGARSTNDGTNTTASDPFALDRINMTDTTSLSQVESEIQGALANHEWIILVFHHVNNTDSGGPEVVSTSFFQNLADYLASQHVPIVTNAQGVALMTSAQ